VLIAVVFAAVVWTIIAGMVEGRQQRSDLDRIAEEWWGD
jgi:hypothetical protein